MTYAGIADRARIEAECAWADRALSTTIWDRLSKTAEAHPAQPAISYQLLSGPKDKAETLTWAELRDKTAQTANLLRSLGIGESDVVAYVLPNATETVLTLLGGCVAGIVNPINPLLEPEQIASILRETGAKVVVTLKPFPKTDVAQKVQEAVRHAPDVDTVLEVDLNRYLTPPKSWIVPLIRPKLEGQRHADYLDFNKEVAKHPKTLQFADSTSDRVAAYFHTGGTTGMPKVAQHKYSGMIYNGFLGDTVLFTENDTMICPLPLFHVMATQALLMSAMAAGSHVVFPTPQGYRGEGVMDNFWKLCERWNVTYIITVPTAVAALMQRKVDADISSVKFAISGSAPMPQELFKRFEDVCGLSICEGYGMTEATCLVAINPPDGEKKIGSVGLPFPYTDVKIVKIGDGSGGGGEPKECAVDEIGEICVDNPGVIPGGTYTEQDKNADLFHWDRYLRTGDLGRIDADGYLWITGRAKDLIIRGGHNIDPAEIEDALLSHPAVAVAGAIGQPDARAGEVPCAFVELVAGATVSSEDLLEHARTHVHERAAHPKHMTILPELPKTAVGKVFKPDLRKHAITRVYNGALEEAGVAARVVAVVDDKKRGLVAQVTPNGASEADVAQVLGDFVRPWEWAEAEKAA
ncbi:acyl-CoA synthetase [Cognatishimia sp. F0-27]|uniref:acyl-CoA synthetase n=1 Tax=Cognatishimia sp. F0-27 TaxID=2816855 RepID=UPI001D0CBF2A|nr:acyl-CoA synthetase [Cognatishimia sp. F0-27]MCC1494463.1 acyl-CoA synthetase [Cognatishimia sp. F0-27]